ncbi:MAG: nicotinate-nucleotide adenylyltransferase [Gemmatimonadota bacterium]
MIGLLGGSFDPIHHGHLIVAQSALEQLGLTEIRFVVAREQPFKQGRHVASAVHRARMVELAIEGQPQFLLESIELELPAPSYTVDTLRALKQREPEAAFTVLLGSDTARELPKWREASEVASLSTICVFGRPGEAGVSSPLVHQHITVPLLAISATAIRQRAKDGLPLRFWVPDSVDRYIRENRLYS